LIKSNDLSFLLANFDRDETDAAHEKMFAKVKYADLPDTMDGPGQRLLSR
jgi:hypothetical protein